MTTTDAEIRAERATRAPLAATGQYRRAGWSGTLALPARAKSPPPAGYTGADGAWPTDADIEAWLADDPAGNLALRLPRMVVGLDVDAYAGKPGGATLAALEGEHGELPPTWTTTSRHDGVSGIRLYRVPHAIDSWPTEAGPGIEMIRYAHRYAVVWPSEHPEGGTYRWRRPEGSWADDGEIPSPGDLPELPAAWVEALTGVSAAGQRDPSHTRTGSRAEARERERAARDWLRALPSGEPCRYVGRLAADALAAARRESGAAYDHTRDAVLALVRAGEVGHPGVRDVLARVRAEYVGTVAETRGGESIAAGEYDRYLYGGVELVLADPSERSGCDCAGPSQRGACGAPPRAEPVEDAEEEEEDTRRLPAPMGVADLLAVEEPEEEWLVEGLIPAGGNFLLAGYPKTYKTMVLLELAVALATESPFLGRYRVPTRRRSGIVLMEDMAHRVRRRLHRLCIGRGVDLANLDGWLYVWCRPPLRLTDSTVRELGDDVEALELDFLGVDSWAYVSSGDSNSADEVTPQLLALSACRTHREGLTVELTHHARKTPGDGSGDRLTDLIRNSGAFGAWYDAGLVLGRKDETSPVTVRAELRDHESPEAFAFEVEDQYPGSADNGQRSGGWLRLRASDQTPHTLERRAAAEKLVPAVREYLGEQPEGVSRAKLREVPGTNADVEAAFDLLVELGEAIHTPSPGPGRPANYALRMHLAEPCRHPAAARSEEDLADPATDAPVGGGAGRQGSEATSDRDPADATAGKVDDLLTVEETTP